MLNDLLLGVPINCSSTMMFDLFYRLLPRDLSAEPLHLNTFLPVFTLTGYATQNMFISLNLYNDLEKAIVNFMKQENLVMKGTCAAGCSRIAGGP